MYQVSEALDTVISGSGRTFYARLNGVQEGIQQIEQTAMSIPDDYMYIGGAISSKIDVSMYTKSANFKNGVEVKFEIGAYTGDEIEWIPMGFFTVNESKKDRDLLTFVAYDRIGTLLNAPYNCKIQTYPAESREFLDDISKQTGIEFDFSGVEGQFMIDKILSVDNDSDDKVYKAPFDGFTMQQVVGYIAQLYGKFAVCDRSGKVVFRWYNKVKMQSDGNHILDNVRLPIKDQAGDFLYDQIIDYSDDGRIRTQLEEFLLDQDSFFIYDTLQYYSSAQTYIIKTNRYFDDLVKNESKCEIKGIGCRTETEYFATGESDDLITENQVMTQEWIDSIWAKIGNISFFPASFSFMGDPRLDVGDVIVIIDASGNPVNVPVMKHTLKFDGGLLSKVSSHGVGEIEIKSPTSEALSRVKNDVLKLNELIAKKITADTADILYARLDKVNIEDGWIGTAMIGDVQITDAKIASLTANKITAGTIDASEINVINLNADNMTVGKINWKQLSDEVNNSIVDSANKASNALSTANSSIQTVIIEYYSSLSETELIGGSWSQIAPEWDEGRYIWSRNKTTTKEGNVTCSNAVCITGNTGAKGDTGAQGIQGIQGEKGDQGIPGTNGKTTYFHIKYSSVAKPTSASQMTETPSTYIGTYVDYTEADSTDPNKYTWSRFQGVQGAKGDQGIPGVNGSNGQTSYLHIAYANSADGKTGFDVSNGTGKLYIGQYTDFTQADSTDPTKYTWTKIKGDTGAQGIQGIGIKSIKSQYYLSNSSTTQSGGSWMDKQPAWKVGYYIWTRSYIVWSNNTSTTTDPVLAEALNTANGVANTALTTADGKNTVFYQTSQPSVAGRKQNDIWYDTGNGNAMYYFDGSKWVKKLFGNSAIDSISASKITTGTLDASKVTVSNLNAGSITAGTLTGIDAIFNKSFSVKSPISTNSDFIINASSSGFNVGISATNAAGSKYYEAVIGFDSSSAMEVRTENNLRITGKKHLSLVSNENIVMYPSVSNGKTNVYINNGATNNLVLHSGNFFDEITKVKNSEKLNGMGVVNVGTKITNSVPWINQTGVMEIGKYLDFHNSDSDTSDFGVRLELNNNLLKISSGSTTVIDLNGKGNASYIKFSGNGTTLGWLGLDKKDGSLMLYDSNSVNYRILDETFIASGTPIPTGLARKGDLYIQLESTGTGWKKATAVYYYAG